VRDVIPSTDVRQVVVMGVSGVGKSTVAKGLSTLMRWQFAEGDAFHPEANLTKMSAGRPLTDEDRWPWLRAIGDWMSREIAAGRSGVVTCSALRRAYRDLLREGRPEVVFCHLAATEDLVATRIGARADHFMPASLLHSQYDTLEPLEADEPGVEVSVDGSAAEVLARAVDALHLQPEGESS
jgi:gluconokinase